MFVPKSVKKAKDFGAFSASEDDGDALKRLTEDVARMRDEAIKQNRDNMDALNNIDMDNVSPSLRNLFKSWTDGISSANARITAIADSQGSLIEFVTQFQADIKTNTSNIAKIQQQADEDGARIDLVVERKNGQNVINSAAISAAISGEESLLQLIADKVVIKGEANFVKKDDLGDNGSTEVSGNRIALIMDGSYDDGQSSFDGNSSLRFDYKDENGNPHLFGWLYMQAEGVETDDTSRYALQIRTTSFRRSYDMRWVDPSIKLISSGRMSMEAQGQIYMYSAAWYILMESRTGLRVRANLPYADAVSEDAAAWNDYVFATDGIYYNGTKIVST
jgi:hypothetical protein